MEANLPSKPAFPYANWGPVAAVLGVFLALATGAVLGVPAVELGHRVIHERNGETHVELTTWANVVVQFTTAIGFVMVPMLIAARQGASFREALRRLGLRSFRSSAFKWMAAGIGAYLFFAFLYSTLIGQPHQKDIAKGFGAVPIQVLLIVVAAPVSEEVCFRGMLFGGLRERLPRIGAALISALIFGGLHALTGISAVPPLIAFGFVLALLYEKTGSIVPGILLHMLNNSVALLGQ